MCNKTIETAQAEWEMEQGLMPKKTEFLVDHSFVEKLPEILSTIDKVIAAVRVQTETDRNLILVSDEDFTQATSRCALLNKQRDLIKAEIKEVKSEYIKMEKLIKRINKKCCTHYNGTGIYHIGYCGLRFLKVAVCDDCGEAQYIGSPFWGWLMDIVFFMSNGRIFILEEVKTS